MNDIYDNSLLNLMYFYDCNATFALLNYETIFLRVEFDMTIRSMCILRANTSGCNALNLMLSS